MLKIPCPECQSPYTRFDKHVEVRVDETPGIKVSVPAKTQYRCMACGKSFTIEHAAPQAVHSGDTD